MRALLVGSLAILLLLGLPSACNRGPTPTPDGAVGTTSDPDAAPGGGRPLAAAEPTPGIRFRLSDADLPEPGVSDSVPRAEAADLNAEQVAALAERLPELPAGEAEQVDFALRPGPRPPAITGDTQQVAWPPQDDGSSAAPEVAEGALTVLRHSPEGDVDLVPRLSLTFSQPMVPLTSHAVLAAEEVPVTLEPQPAGEWRWVGSRTLLFEPEGGRFPKATDYRVEVPAGQTSTAGATLGEAFTWTFTTPPLRVASFYPQGGPTDRQPLLFVAFDQAIDAAAILPAIEARAGRDAVALRAATPEEIAADESIGSWIEGATEGRYLILRPESELPRASKVRVTFPAGLPSAEGPLGSEEEQSYEFEVYGDLEVTDVDCNGSDGRASFSGRGGSVSKCEPFGGLYVGFSNPLDPSSFDLDDLRVDPPVADLDARADGQLYVSGAFLGQTTYTFGLPAGLRDIYGQALGDGVAVTMKTRDMRPALMVPGNDMLVLDPAADGKMELFSINNDRLDARIYQVGLADWPAYETARRSVREETPQDPPGQLVWEGEVEPQGERDGIASAAVDLSPALNDEGFGQLVLVVEPEDWSWEDENWQNRPQWRWIQVTDLGVDVQHGPVGPELKADDPNPGAGAGSPIILRVTELQTGAPVAGASLQIGDEGGAIRSDDDGLALLPGPRAYDGQINDRETMVVARDGDDQSFLLLWSHRQPMESYRRWFVFDDRGLYKPGETLSVKGWLREIGAGPTGDVGALGAPLEAVRYTLMAQNGEEMLTGAFQIDPLGGFHGSLVIPEEIELGEAMLRLSAEPRAFTAGRGNEEHVHVFQVAEFRRPEFEVSAQLDSPDPIFGEQAVVTAGANYYAGGALPGADLQWQVIAEPSNYSPPGHEGYVFGTWQPWWGWSFDGPYREPQYEGYEARTDALGEHRLAVHLEGIEPAGPANFRVEATVEDLNRQAWTASTNFLAHSAETYVGLRSDRWFAEQGQDFRIEAIATEIDGDFVSDQEIQIRALSVARSWSRGEYEETLTEAGGCALVSTGGAATCTLSFEAGGEYRIVAEVVDAAGRLNRSRLTVWVKGARPELPRTQRLELQEAQLIPDADEYQPGDTASILVRSPFAPAEGLLSLRRSGTLRVERFSIGQEGDATLEIPIEDAQTPNLYVHVELVGAAPRLGADGQADPELPARPAFASAEINLPIPPLGRTLNVEASPALDAVEPGALTNIDVLVRDADGNPLPEAEVALVVVDEAILALSGHSIADPMDYFYSQRGPDVQDHRSRERIVLADPGQLTEGLEGMSGPVGESFMSRALGALGGGDDMAMMDMDAGDAMAPQAAMMEAEEAMDESANGRMSKSMAYDAAGDGAGEAAAPIIERSDLNPLAAFVPDARTDEDGRVNVEVNLPDNVTRYRVVALATDGGQRFGKGESALVARLPLIVRPSAPRFLNFGDVFELPVLVQNQTDEDLEVDLVLRALNLRLGAASADAGTAEAPSSAQLAGQRAIVPAGDRVEFRIPASALLPGTALFQAAAIAVDGSAADAQRVSLPVWTPATTEAFATYGEVDEGSIAQPVLRPDDVVESFGGLELTTSSTAVSGLTDAYLSLHRYPFEHVEPVASRLIATVALQDVLSAFGAEGLPSEEEIRASVDADIARLAGMQNSDGGFGWWPSERRSSPFSTLHAVHALTAADAKAHPVPAETLERGRDYLRDIESHLRALDYCRHDNLCEVMRSHALYVRAISDDLDPDETRELLGRKDDLPVEAQAWLLSVLTKLEGFETERDEVRRNLANLATEEAGTAQFTTGFSEDAEAGALLLASDRRTDAIVLDALMADQPDSDLIPKVVRGLLAHRVKGQWGSTQENAWVLLALDRYFRVYEAETPDFVARAWLGDGFAGETEFRGRSADRSLTQVPMAALPEGETTPVILQKEGAGRLYYRLGLRYAPEDLDLEPLERGFSVERVYEGVDDPADVRRRADGAWEVKAGARVRVRLTMVAEARRYHVALVDPLPAGLEAQNPELLTTASTPPEEIEEEDGFGRSSGWWWGPWQDHESFRDERVEAFTSSLREGVHPYSYIARATTPGNFVVPPARAEELYHPETFGRSGSDRVIVVP